jgi:hypothetical protein
MSAWGERVLRISVFPSRTMTSIGTSFADIAPEFNAPTTSIVRPEKRPPLLNVSVNEFWANFAPAYGARFDCLRDSLDGLDLGHDDGGTSFAATVENGVDLAHR